MTPRALLPTSSGSTTSSMRARCTTACAMPQECASSTTARIMRATGKIQEHGASTVMTSYRQSMIYEGACEKGKMHGHDACTPLLYPDKCPKKERKVHGELPSKSPEWPRCLHPTYQMESSATTCVQIGHGVFRWPDMSIHKGPWQDRKHHGAYSILIGSNKRADI